VKVDVVESDANCTVLRYVQLDAGSSAAAAASNVHFAMKSYVYEKNM
jgi:hypothetical protein